MFREMTIFYSSSGEGRDRKCLRLLMIHVLEFLNFNDAELILPFLSLPRWLERGCLPTFFYIIIPAFRGVSMESFRSFRKILRSVFQFLQLCPPPEIIHRSRPRFLITLLRENGNKIYLKIYSIRRCTARKTIS